MSAYNIQTLADFIRPIFPPNIAADELVPNTTRKGNAPKKTSNAFFIYRKSCIQRMNENKLSIAMPIASPIIAKLWAEEPQSVKNEYKQLAKEAKEIYNTRHGLKNDLSTFVITHENIINTSNIVMPNTTTDTLDMTLPDNTNLVSVKSSTPNHSIMSLGCDSNHVEGGHAENTCDTNLFSSTNLSTFDFDLDYSVFNRVNQTTFSSNSGSFQFVNNNSLININDTEEMVIPFLYDLTS